MVRVDSTGRAGYEEDLRERPYGEYVGRGTYAENNNYRQSTASTIIHYYPTSDDNLRCALSNEFCEYNPANYTKGDPGVNITRENACIVVNNQFVVANMKNSINMEVTVMMEGIQTEAMTSARVYLLHGEDLEVYCERDATDGFMHIHYSHPSNSSYVSVDIPTTVHFENLYLFKFIVDYGRCTLRAWNVEGDNYTATEEYTYNFPSGYKLSSSELWGTVTGVSATSTLFLSEIEYVYNDYTPPSNISIGLNADTPWDASMISRGSIDNGRINTNYTNTPMIVNSVQLKGDFKLELELTVDYLGSYGNFGLTTSNNSINTELKVNQNNINDTTSIQNVFTVKNKVETVTITRIGNEYTYTQNENTYTVVINNPSDIVYFYVQKSGNGSFLLNTMKYIELR